MKKLFAFLVLASVTHLSLPLFASPTADFSINPVLSRLVQSSGILYSRTGSLSLSGIVSPNVETITFSGMTLTGGAVYRTGRTLADINGFFPSNTSLTGGMYHLSAFDGSGLLLGSEELIIDKMAPKVQKITYFDMDRNGKTDRLTVEFDEDPTGLLNLPYSTGMTVSTRKWGLMASGSTTSLDFSDHIVEAGFVGNSLVLDLQEGDMIKNRLAINANAGSSASDLKFGLYTNATVTDIAGNVATLATSKFPNSSTGIFNGTAGIDFLDTGYLYGSNFSGALIVGKIDSRSKTGPLVLSGIVLSVSADSFLGDGNVLQIATGSRLEGNGSSLSIGSESHILGNTGAVLFGKEGFSSAFRTLSGEILSDVSTVSESGIYYTYNGTLIGSWITLAVDYVSDSGVLSLFSGALSGTSALVTLPHELVWGNLRATVSKTFGAGESTSFSGITLVFDTLTQSSVTFAASIVSTGTISDIAKDGARLSGAVFRPSISGNIYYGTWELSQTGTIQSGSFLFAWLTPGTMYFYRLGLVPFPLWDEIFSQTGSFATLPAPKIPPPVSIAFQNTTYLTDQNPLLNEFTCDNTHTDCKVNFNLESSFTPELPLSDYFCELDYDLDYSNGEEYKCNPGTVVFPRGHDYNLHFRILNTLDVNLFTERTLLIHAPALAESASSPGTVSGGPTSSGSGSFTWALDSTGTLADTGVSDNSGTIAGSGAPTGSWTLLESSGSDNSWSPISSGSSLVIADPEIIIQSGIDASGKCTKTDCIINLQYVPKHSQEACHWDFPGGVYSSGTENGCNPGYIHYPIGDFSVTLRVYEKDNVSNFREKALIFSNPAPVLSSGGGSTVSASIVIPLPTSIPDPIIVVQSGLDATNHCLKSDCVVNFDYKVLGPKEACHWDFPGGSYVSGTENKCNPGYVHYPLGEFSVTLRVYEQGNVSNYREKTMKFANGSKAVIEQMKNSPENRPPHAAIKLQGTLGKTKKQQGNSVTCIWTDECSINLSGEESYDLDHDKIAYLWNFWNGETSSKENPAAVKYGVGEYTAILRVTDMKGLWSEDTFHVSVLGKKSKEPTPEKTIDPNVFSLKITGVSPNPLGNDGVSEWAEIMNPLGVPVSLAGCTLDDEIGKGSNPYVFNGPAIVPANSKKRYYKLQTLINFNNTGDSANLSCDGRLVSTLVWDYPVPEGFIVSGQQWPYSGKVRVKVLRTIDGDTIEIELYGKKEKVRLLGVDTPETVDPRKKLQFFGKEASNYTKSRLEGREIELEFDFDQRDKYDRLLAYVWIDGANFDLELIRLGYARAYLRFPFRYFKEFERAGKEAMKNKVGMWADPEMKKTMETEAKEDKKALEEQLQEEDKAILDDLIEIAEETKTGSEKLDAEILDRLLILDKEEKPETVKYRKVREALERTSLEDIHISLQWKLSKNRTLAGNIFTCRTQKTCSVNFTAGKTRKDTLYLWDFGNGQTFSGANPKAQKFWFGKYTVTLKVIDRATGSIREETFSVVIQKLMTTKKKRVKKAKGAAIPKEKPLVIRWQNFLTPPSIRPVELSPLQASASGWIIALVFFWGMHAVIRRKGIV